MMLATLGLLAALAAAGFPWGLARIRRGQAQAFAAARDVRAEDVPGLVDECIRGLAALGEHLDIGDPQAVATLLDRHLAGPGLARLKLGFARADFGWYFVMPTGAVLGEWLRLHAGGAWNSADGGGLCIVLPLADGSATAHPFEKVVKQATGGRPGDVIAYLQAARELAGAAAPGTVESA